ncbi:MAG: PilZ domain-containing protein [Steroidobacteraceae bacterium]
MNLRAAVARLRKGIQKRGRAIMVHVPIGSEHRWGERVRVDLPVNVLEDGRAPVDGCLKNISLSGALLKSSHDFPLHALIEVRIERLSSTADSSVVKARVSRKPVQGIGIEWCEFAPVVVKELLRRSPARYPL